MGTNFYVETPRCPDACEHCSASQRLHLGKRSAGWRFLFRADPDWPRDQAFDLWKQRAESGLITDEYGGEHTLAELLNGVAAMAGLRSHLGAGRCDDFPSGGHDFCDREFS